MTAIAQPRFGQTLESVFFSSEERKRWPIVSRQYALSVRAREFLNDRYRQLGISSLPDVSGPFVVSSDRVPADDSTRLIMESDGLGSAIGRWFGVRERSVDQYWNEDFTQALMVHEITHAMGALRLRSQPNTRPSIMGLGMTARSRSGFFPLFVALDEYVACSNEALFFRARGYQEVAVANRVTYRVMPDSDHSEKLARLCLEVYGSPDSQAWREQGAAAKGDWNDILKENPGACLVLDIEPQRHVRRLSSGATIHKLHIYGLNTTALDKLAFELFPEQDGAQAIQAFRDHATVAHVTGATKGLFRLIRHRLGPAALKVIAFARPDLDNFSCDGQHLPHVSTLLLALFADARWLPADRRARVRHEIGVLIDPR